MSEYTVQVEWQRGEGPFTDQRYSRGHVWRFDGGIDGGIEVPASSSPHVVPVPLSVAEAVDPEEAFVASLSSCHMLWFLSIVARRGLVVEHYKDDAIGVLERDDEGRWAMTRVTLRPMIHFHASEPSPEELKAMHEEAHDNCFIANSVRTAVSVEPAPFRVL